MGTTMIYTRNTAYEVKDGDRPGTSIVNGGQFKDVEIFTPKNEHMSVGDPFHFITTDNPNNGRLRNQIMNTSSIQSMGSYPEKITYELNTKNSQYKLTTVPGRPDIMTVSGGALTGLEIKTPSVLPEIDERFRFEFTDNPINGSNRGRVMSTSSLQSINKMATVESPAQVASNHFLWIPQDLTSLKEESQMYLFSNHMLQNRLRLCRQNSQRLTHELSNNLQLNMNLFSHHKQTIELKILLS